jgi:perosamine synthetase
MLGSLTEFHLPSYPEEPRLLEPVLAEGDFAGRSHWVGEYEAALARHFGVARAIATSSGSAALHTALHVLATERRGGTVIVPAAAPVPTVLPVLATGLEPVFVDVQLDSFAFDAPDLERKLDERCVAAITVPMYGYPHDYGPMQELLVARGVPLVEDAAHAHGTRVDGRLAGTLGTAGCFSTHQRKLLVTGEGGFLLIDDSLADRAKDFTALGVGGHEPVAVNHKLSGIQAVLGTHRLGRLEERIQARRRNAERILDGLAGTAFVELGLPPRSRCNHYALALRLDAGADELARVRSAHTQAGVPCENQRFGGRPIYESGPFRRFAQCCPNAERLLESLFVMPCHEGLTEPQLDVIVRSLRGD